ncbi:MAG TPA: hypothetical protein VJ844_14295, partial [Mucilaginibacter sp.]|nr:hypothetical protein [Mucilaginibacter sp.]
FLGLLANNLLPKVILVHMFWVWLPWFQKFQFFTVSLSWYGWIYGYLCWEFSAWLFHFTSHRVRLLPLSAAKTAPAIRQEFLKTNPELGITTREKIISSVRSRSREPQAMAHEVPAVSTIEIK